MNRHGFTLVEVIIAVAIAGILLSIASLQFSDYLQKGAIERQTKEMYADLIAARTAAVTQQALKTVIITPTTYSIDGRTKELSKPITWSGKSSGDTEKQIIFDQRGTFNIDVANGNTTICVDPSLEAAQYDSIVVYSTRLHLGKLSYGEVCTSDKVSVK